ncbi:hypothetical protein OF829_14750 [Sphingomonas sp. LB-2]|uniref:hypothetical protein n=1 Tax=Sphingomonas caeni TaxID=2984949 RepID=UPI00223138EC|nr:hypothetical protein [Sphingomonas caeni]MCW3848498.1 hypothetical protein [Sphingomonas caeni]
MGGLLRLMGAMALSLAVYFAASALLLNKPVTYDSITRMVDRKIAYAEKQPSPKLVLIGGSGVRTSHRCDVLAAETGWPCVNGGATVGLGLNYVFAEYQAFLKPGDVVYLPLEYQQFTITRAQLLTGPDAAILFRKDWKQLAGRGPEGFARAAFMADIDYVSQSLIEQALSAAGVRARFDKQTSNAFGDQTGLTHEAGRTYDGFIATTGWRPPSVAQFRDAHGAKDEIARFLDWCRAHGVRVIAGLPVAFDKPRVDDDLIGALRAFYAGHGATLIVMDNRSQYPRDWFYDTPFHLEEEHAVEHSRRLAPYLKAALPRR